MQRLENLTLKTRLGAALAVVVAMTVALGAFALHQFDTLAGVTANLYEHPLQVSNASLRASQGVSRMNLYMETLTSPIQKLSHQAAAAALDEEEKRVYENLDIVRDRILGAQGQALERETRALFAGWRPVRAQILALIVGGNKQGGAAVRAEKGWPYAERVERKMQELNAYSRKKADSFMAEATRVETRARRATAGIVAVAAVLSALLLFVVLRSIILSVSSLKATMSEISSTGKFVKSDLAGKSEIAEMARYFNSLIDVLQRQFRLKEGLNALSGELSGRLSREEVATRGVRVVARHVDGCAGAVYSRDPERGGCELLSSYARGEGGLFALSFGPGEGVVGQVASERRPILLGDIPAAQATIRSGTVAEPPRSLYALPLVHGGDLEGVLEVAAFHELDEGTTEFLDAAGAVLATALSAAAQARRIEDLLRATQESNEALTAKTDQLNAANEEMTAVNAELRTQADELQAQAEELRAQATEMEAQQSQLQEADRLKSEFLSNMSHELRTPLNSVLALSQLMISRGVGKNPKQEQEYLRVIERNGRQLLFLINDILDLSKIESGRMDVFLTEFDPRRIAERVVETVDPLARGKALSLVLRPGATGSMRSDEDKVQQILLNLVSNAVKFTERGGVEITVGFTDGAPGAQRTAPGSARNAARVSFTVRDTGIGIGEADLGYIFDEFRQVDGSTTRRHEGTGLGLAICQKLARLLGGTITVESAPGKGSTFTLSLPLHPAVSVEPRAEAGAPSLAEEREHHRPLASAQGLALVIDDEAEVRRVLAEHLTAAGFRVLGARDGPEGLELARRHRPTVITLDVMMPGMDGWEVISRLKASPETADIPVVMVSVSDDRATGLALGASGYVPKPLDRTRLLTELEGLAATRRVRRVLVVDDDPAVREQLSSVLGERGYRVETAAGGAEGLALVRQHRPDALILDLMMPDLDGFAVLERLRSDPATRDLPVVVLTAKDLTAGERASLRHSAQQIVGKGDAAQGPLLDVLDRAIEHLLAPSGGGHVGRRRREPLVLVVEDNAVATLQIRSALEESGYLVDTAAGGVEALQRVAVAIPDAVVLDLMMPGVDGFQVLEQIRSTPRTARLPVLVLTAKELTAEDRARLTHNHVQELVQKGSLDRDQLVARVGRLLGREEPALRPGAVPPPEPDPEPVATRPAAAAGRGGRILVAEDNPDNRFTITALLEELGYEHETVEDGRQAVLSAKRLRPALILMDMQLPVLGGLDATRQIKADGTLLGVPIVALTARAMKGDREEILAAGCDDYLSKPLDPAALAAALRKWMA